MRLESDRLGIVIDQTKKSLPTPKVRGFFSAKSNIHIPPEVVDLSIRSCPDRIVSCEDPGKGISRISTGCGGVSTCSDSLAAHENA